MDADPLRNSLDESDSVAILLNIYDAGRKLSLSELAGQVINYYSLRKRVAQFEEEDLVVVSLETKPRKTVFVGLTPKGRKVGALLDGMRKLLPPGDIADSPMSIKHAVPVTVMLFRNGPMRHNDFLQVYKSYVPLVKKLFPALEKEGIVRQWVTTEGYKANMIELTELGKEIGSLLDEVFRIIGKK